MTPLAEILRKPCQRKEMLFIAGGLGSCSGNSRCNSRVMTVVLVTGLYFSHGNEAGRGSCASSLAEGRQAASG